MGVGFLNTSAQKIKTSFESFPLSYPNAQILAKRRDGVVAIVGVFEWKIPVDGMAAKQVAHYFLHDIYFNARGSGAGAAAGH